MSHQEAVQAESQRRVTSSSEPTHTDPEPPKWLNRNRPTCGPAHQQQSSKSALSPPALSSYDNGVPSYTAINRDEYESWFVGALQPIEPTPAAKPLREQQDHTVRRDCRRPNIKSGRGYRKRVKMNLAPSISARSTSSTKHRDSENNHGRHFSAGLPPGLKKNKIEAPVELELTEKHILPHVPESGRGCHFAQVFGVDSQQPTTECAHPATAATPRIDLKGRRHVDLDDRSGHFDLLESCTHAPVARDWPSTRKRFAATLACINTACVGLVIGIYSGEVPAIQYVIVDFYHYTILGNVFLYCGLAIPTLLFWPLPLLHGRKPYILVSLAIALCLQIPQGIAVGTFRSPYVSTFRRLLLISRAISGFALGFVNVNLQATLLDLFGASLQSNHPHGEMVDAADVRRHGGGLGLWLGLWSWCSTGSIGVGFAMGAWLISGTTVDWGFWTSLIILMVVLLLNVIAPEVRRSAYRRTLIEIRKHNHDFSRVARGEIKMHLHGTGPYWWGEEVLAGLELCWSMLTQPGFLILAVYIAWVYAQFTMILMFLGALASRYYMLGPVDVGLCALSLAGGGLLATPFQKASWLSRARYRPPKTDSMTLKSNFPWTSHLLRRTFSMVLLPLAAVAYTLTSRGPPSPVAVPCIFAAIVGFFTNLALAECHGLIMETFDTSDLQPGMTGRIRRKSIVQRYNGQRTNFSCYPRVSAGCAVTQFLQFVLGAVATGVCGRLLDRVGALVATACVAGVLLGLTLLLTGVLIRWKIVKMIPDASSMVDAKTNDGRTWEPVIIGHPSGTIRKISILEGGRLTRWSEIRRRNRLGDEMKLTRS